MNLKMKICLTALSLMSFGVASYAQQNAENKRAQEAPPPAVRRLTQEQQAALDKLDQDIGQVALNIARMIDENKTSEVWEGASPVAKQIISRDDFLKTIARIRGPLGAPTMRMPMGVRHYRYDGTGKLPAGAYINVPFDTQFAHANRSSREMVTLILDADNVWRFVGYSVN